MSEFDYEGTSSEINVAENAHERDSEEFNTALEEALEVAATLGKMIEIVGDKETKKATDTTALDILQTAVEHMSSRVGIASTFKIGTESYNDKPSSFALEDLKTRLKNLWDMIVKAVINFINKITGFINSLYKKITEDNKNIATIKKALDASKSVSDKPYMTKYCNYILATGMQAAGTRTLSNLSTDQVCKILEGYIASSFEFNVDKRIETTLAFQTELLTKLKNEKMSKTDVAASVRSTIEVFFSNTYASQIDKVNGKLTEKHNLYFNGDKLISVYNIEDLTERASTVSITKVPGQIPLDRAVFVLANDMSSVKTLFGLIEEVGKKNEDLNTTLKKVETFLAKIKEQVGICASNATKESKDKDTIESVPNEVLIAKNLLSSVQTYIRFINLMVIRNSEIIRTYGRIVTGVVKG